MSVSDMSEENRSLFDRVTSHPIFYALIAAFWIKRGIATNWDLPWYGWICLVVFSLWFVWSVPDQILDQRLSEWFSRLGEGDQEFFSSWEEYDRRFPESTPFVKLLKQRCFSSDGSNEMFRDFESEEFSELAETAAIVMGYKYLTRADDPDCCDVLSLMGRPGSEEAYSLFFNEAMPLVQERFEEIYDRDIGPYDHRSEHFLSIELLVGFGYQPAFGDIVRASQDPRLMESFMWGRIFDRGNPSDPDFRSLLKALSNDLPKGFAGVAFLDRCNALLLAEEVDLHPFSSDAGVARLKEYFSDRDPEHFSYATSASTALPYITHPERDPLLEFAGKHPHHNVRVEVAWAGAKLGIPKWIESLSEMTLDWKTGGRALEFLEELGLQSRIPGDALNFENRAISEVADWLQHPNELAKLPDSISIVDRREVFWPACEEERQVAILQWELGEDSGLAMYGGTTIWCFFGDKDGYEPVIDFYAKHLNWQMRAMEMEGAPESYSDLDFGRKLLRDENPEMDWS